MADQKGKDEDPAPRGKDTRHDRLKLALRENLKRRKVQARERSKAPEMPSTDDEASPHGQVGKRRD